MLRTCLMQGQPDAVADRAIAALGTRAERASVPTLIRFLHHRRAAARAEAAGALGRIGGAAAERAVIDALADSDESVREAAAQALARMDAEHAEQALFAALEAGVTAAADALGKLGSRPSVARYAELLGKLPLALLLRGSKAFLARADLPVADRVSLVRALSEAEGPALADFFAAELGARAPNDPLRPALSKALLIASRKQAKAKAAAK